MKYRPGDPIKLMDKFADALMRNPHNHVDWRSRRGTIDHVNSYQAAVCWPGRKTIEWLPLKAIERCEVMTKINEATRNILIPSKMMKMPVSKSGYLVPWFVGKVDGEWDFRVVEPNRLIEAIVNHKCWMCGERLGTYLAFVTGPMCTITRTSAEPPCHLECAEYAAKACPFLSKPKMKRNENDLPEGHMDPAGIFIRRNPGVSAIYITKTFKPIQVNRQTDGSNILIRMGDPERMIWYAEGRMATRDEVQASIDSGMPLLEEEARKDNAMAELNQYITRMRKFLPPEPEGDT